MESSRGVDDQGSGWMQVKKKHRSNLKFSRNSCGAGEIPGKQSSKKPSNMILGRNAEPRNESQSLNTQRDSVVRDVNIASNSTSTSADDKAADNLSKSAVSEDENMGSFRFPVVDKSYSCYKLVVDEEHPHKNSVLPKIKWGDLDEGTLVHYGKTPDGGISFGGIKSHNVVPAYTGSSGEALPCVASLDPEKHNFVDKAIDEDRSLPNYQSPRKKNISVEETFKEVNEVSSEEVKEQITCEQIVVQDTVVSVIEVDHLKSETDVPVDPSMAHGVCPAYEEEAVREDSDVPAAPITDSALSMGSTTICFETPVPENFECGSVDKSTLESSAEELPNVKEQVHSDDFLDTQSADDSNLDVTGESKERFRERLWCFLFENLNRAVDELYLLCELECDLEQMKEASLVLEEAASDFIELKSRVEKFDKSKRSSSHDIEGAPLIMNADHRRPHALSWEVRRITTSPRRAEILSSSLEAFRQIQEERSSEREKNVEGIGSDSHYVRRSSDVLDKRAQKDDIMVNSKELAGKARKQSGVLDTPRASSKDKRNLESGKRGSAVPRLPPKEGSATCMNGRSNRDSHASTSEMEKVLNKKVNASTDHTCEKTSKPADAVRRSVSFPEKEREKRNGSWGKSMDAWKEKRNWEDVLSSPHRVSSRFSYSPGMSRKSAERVRGLHDKLMSPEKKKKSSLDLKKEAEEKHARATRIRTQLENERVQRLQKTSEKLNRASEWYTVRSNKLRESMFARHQRSESRHEAHLAQVVRRAGDESSKVNEVRFITSLNEENKKHILRKKLQDSELRRAEKLQVMRTKQKEDMAREEAVLERKKLIEAEKLQRLAETQRKKEEAQVRREEEWKASSAAREAKSMENMRRKEIRAKAQQEEAELLAQRLAQRLRESEQRRKVYLEQIRERASMDFRDQSSPLLRRIAGKEGQAQSRSTPCSTGDDTLVTNSGCIAGSDMSTSETLQHPLKRRIKKIRQRLMSLKHEFTEPSVGLESSGIGYRTAVGTARGKISRWLQELQKLRQARKDGAANFGLIAAEMIKFLEGKDAELHASRQAGLLDFIASSLPASHTSKPEACQVTVYLLRLLRVVLALPANRCYFLVQNLLPPVIPMLAAALENYIKMAASSTITGPTSSASSKTSPGSLESVSETVDGFLWVVAAIIGYVSCNERQNQMQDGLVELVIAYQIIHRLRDLFALYDRPQVEGSPFPSSILLSINMLVVLTSKFRESSLIDWKTLPGDMMQVEKYEQTKLPEAADFGLTAWNLGGNSSSEQLLNVSEGRHLEENSFVQGQAVSDILCNNSNEVKHVASKMEETVDLVGESRVLSEDKCEFSSAQKNNCVSRNAEQKNGNNLDSKHPKTFLLSAMAETGLVCLPSMLTSALLQANNRLSAEQGSYSLPSNFEEVATGVLKVLNNLALIDVTFIQKMLAQPDLQMEFFHLMSFLLSHSTSNWGVSTDKIGLLLLESLSLLGYFALFHSGNQAVLRWGKSPTILHKVCDLPFAFFSNPELMPVLAGTLVAASYGCDQNKAVIQQELSMDMLIPSLKLCKPAISIHNGPSANDTDASQKLSRNSVKSTRLSLQKGGVLGGNVRTMRGRSAKDNRVVKISEELHLGDAHSCNTSSLMLHFRFPLSFIDKAEEFFTSAVGISENDLI